MKNEFIPYEKALALKELGFDEECFGFYDDIDSEHELYQVHTQTWNETHRLNKQLTRAPLYQQAFRFFREKYDEYHTWRLQRILSVEDYETYEKAELECLRQLIEIVNQNKDDE